MGKKFGINSKAEEGREKKLNAKEQQKAKEQKEKEKAEEKKWEDGVKGENKKQQEEAKRLEKLAKKQERRGIEEKESAELSKFKTDSKSSKLLTNRPEPILKSQSLNWSLSSDAGSTESLDAFTASNIDDALLLLESTNISSASINIEKHPERRVKAAFSAFEAREMPKLREEFPSLRHTQLMERLYKLWLKSSENPFNQLHVSHNVSREEQSKAVQDNFDNQLERMRLK